MTKWLTSEFVQYFIVCLHLYCHCRSSYHEGSDLIKRFNSATLSCLSQARPWISNVNIWCCLFCVQWVKMRDDRSFCWYWRHVESNTGKSARQGNLRHPRERFQSFADETRRVGERLKSYPRVSEISLCLALFAGVWFYFSLLSAVFSFVFVYVLLADDHVNNVNYFPFMSIKKVVPYFGVLREGYYVIIWLIVRICVFIKHWKLIYSELFILKRKSMENWGTVDINCTACICR